MRRLGSRPIGDRSVTSVREACRSYIEVRPRSADKSATAVSLTFTVDSVDTDASGPRAPTAVALASTLDKDGNEESGLRFVTGDPLKSTPPRWGKPARGSRASTL